MAFLIGKAVDFVFHAGAIARAYAFDFAREHGAAVKATADDVVRLLIRVRNPAWHLLRVHGGIAHEAENGHGWTHTTHHTVPGLLFALGEINGTSIQTRRRSGFQPTLGEFQFFQTGAQGNRWRITGTPCGVVIQANVNFSIQKRASRQHHRFGAKLNADLRHRTHHLIAFHHQIINGLLKEP